MFVAFGVIPLLGRPAAQLHHVGRDRRRSSPSGLDSWRAVLSRPRPAARALGDVPGDGRCPGRCRRRSASCSACSWPATSATARCWRCSTSSRCCSARPPSRSPTRRCWTRTSGSAPGWASRFLTQDWLGEPDLALGVVVFVVSWQFIPFHSLIYQGGVRQIPTSMYEAAAARRRRPGPAVLQHHAAAAEVHDHHLVDADGGRVADLLRPDLRAHRGRARRRHPGARAGHVQARASRPT